MARKNVSGWAIRHGSINVKAPMFFTLSQKVEGGPVYWTFIQDQALILSGKEDAEHLITFMKRHPAFAGKKPEPMYLIL